MEAQYQALDGGTRSFLNNLRTPVWVLDLEGEAVVFSNDKANKLTSSFFQLECVNNETNDRIVKMSAMIAEALGSGKSEFKGTFVTEEGAKKATFLLSTMSGSGRAPLVVVELQNLKWSKDFELSAPLPTEFQHNLWNEVKSRLPYAETIMVMYSVGTGKVLLSNKYARERLPKEVLEFGGDSSGINPRDFLPYVVDRSIVDKAITKLRRGDGVRVTAEVRLGSSERQHLFLLEHSRDPATGEEIVVCCEEDVTPFVEAKKPPVVKTAAKTPPEFTAMMGMSELLVSTYLSKEYASPDLLRNSSETLLKIINMFDLCKIDEGAMSLDSLEFDVHTAVEDCVEFACSLARPKGLDIALYTSPNLPAKVVGDSRRLKHVLLNFISNAIKFTKANGGDILVNLKLVPTDCGPKHVTLQMEVTDRGIGVAKENIMDLFLDWSAVANSYKANKEIGLGLAISKQIVELMGGTIGAQSKLGEGSTFWCNVTLEVVQQIGVPPCAYKHAPSNVVGTRVLFVGEEGRSEGKILAKYLEEWGLVVSSVPSGAECIKRLKECMGNPDTAIELVFISATVADMKPFKLHKILDRTGTFGNVHACVLTNKRKLGDRLSTQPVPVRRSRLHDYLGKFAGRRQLYKRITPAPAPALPEQPADAEEPFAESQPAAKAPVRGEINVLVVEDNAMAQVFASRILRKTGGYKVDSVTNGKQAVEAFKKGNFDIILMDCQMPELDGYSATKQIRDLEKETGGHVIIIAVTAMTMQEDRDRCFQMGMDDYLSKPVTNKDLIQKITQWSKQTKINKEEEEFGEFNTQLPSIKRRTSVSAFNKRFDTTFPLASKKDRLLI